jgi:hypothetical protein
LIKDLKFGDKKNKKDVVDQDSIVEIYDER